MPQYRVAVGGEAEESPKAMEIVRNGSGNKQGSRPVQRFISILVGGVIAAAFLGPGTITTAARAGASFGTELLWALVFATATCFVLQEASARLTIASGYPLGQALRQRYGGAGGGAGAWLILTLVLGAVVLGCAAYQAGNILGGVAGAQLASSLGPVPLTAISALLAFALLWQGNTRVVVTALGLLVAVMGFAFVLTALRIGAPSAELIRGLTIPSAPAGAGLLVLGLVGTTVVPYNLFLGSGLAAGQRLADARLGLAAAIGLGGLVSMAVVVVGSALQGEMSFQALAQVLDQRLGSGAGRFFGWGLFAAGFSSAVTAPWAAAITARGLFATGADDPDWAMTSWRFRSVWLAVLAVGTAFGLTGFKPVPVIILAQALNGALLPIVAVFLFVVVNDAELMGGQTNGALANIAMVAAGAISTVLGIRGFLSAAATATGITTLTDLWTVVGLSTAALGAMAFWGWAQLAKPSRRRAS